MLNVSILHMAVACYNLIYYYVLIDYKNSYNNNYIIYNNYNQLQLLIKTNIKLVLHKELLFRVYLAEIMKYIFNFDELVLIWMIAFSSFTVVYHQFDSNITKLSKFIYTFILGYYLITNSVLESVLIHIYTEFLGIVIQKYLFRIFNKTQKTFEIKSNEQAVEINKLKSLINPNIELASKDEVEALLSSKKMN